MALALQWQRNVRRMKSFTRFFSKNRGTGRGMRPGVRIPSGHLKNRLPAIRYGRHFPQAGNRVFSRVVPLLPVLVYRRFSGERQPQKIVVSCFARNAGHAVRPANNFLRACEARPACSSTQKMLKSITALPPASPSRPRSSPVPRPAYPASRRSASRSGSSGPAPFWPPRARPPGPSPG